MTIAFLNFHLDLKGVLEALEVIISPLVAEVLCEKKMNHLVGIMTSISDSEVVKKNK